MYEAPELLTVGEVRNVVLGEKIAEVEDLDFSQTPISILDVD